MDSMADSHSDILDFQEMHIPAYLTGCISDTPSVQDGLFGLFLPKYRFRCLRLFLSDCQQTANFFFRSQMDGCGSQQVWDAWFKYFGGSAMRLQKQEGAWLKDGVLGISPYKAYHFCGMPCIHEFPSNGRSFWGWQGWIVPRYGQTLTMEFSHLSQICSFSSIVWGTLQWGMPFTSWSRWPAYFFLRGCFSISIRFGSCTSGAIQDSISLKRDICPSIPRSGFFTCVRPF